MNLILLRNKDFFSSNDTMVSKKAKVQVKGKYLKYI
jgi:hypothetical protein